MKLAPGMMVTSNVRLERELGRGGMGAVWVAAHLTLETRVAVKFIAPELLERSPEALARFKREGRAVAQVRSPHVVQVHDLGVTPDGIPYIVMELLDGESLADLLVRLGRALTVTEALPIAEQIGKALEHAHAAGIVHRDIKPANVILTRSGNDLLVKVLDFGIAKQSSGPQYTAATATGAIMGTPEYMSPEQVLSSKDVDLRADLWAFAVLVYELLTGRPPFAGETLGALIVAISQTSYAPATQVAPDLPAGMDAWFARTFARSIDDRFPDARQMTAALVQACDPAARRPVAATLPFDPRVNRAPQLEPVSQGRPAEGAFPAADFKLERLVDSNSLLATAPPSRSPRGLVPPHSNRGPTFSGASATVPGEPPPRVGNRRIAMGVATIALVAVVGALAWRGRERGEPAQAGSFAAVATTAPSASAAPTSAPPQGFAMVPAGSYAIGCGTTDLRCFDDEKPPFTIELAAFAIMIDEVTAAEYDACVVNGKCSEPASLLGCTWRRRGLEKHPITCVSAEDAKNYCAWKGLLLPTEAQWEVAARGRGGDYPWQGGAIDCDRAVVDGGCGTKGPMAVGSRPKDASWVGARDMAGNVREWTSSSYAAYPGGTIDPKTKGIVNRGASWVMSSKEANTVHTRGVDVPTERRPDLGFRCVKP